MGVVGRYRGNGPFINPYQHYSSDAIADIAVSSLQAKQNPWELAQLIEIIRRLQPGTILEVGTAFGGTLAVWIACSCSDARIVTLDMTNNPQWGEEWAKLLYGAQELVVLQGDSTSEDTVREVGDLLPAGVDFLFIDANHWYEPVRKDYDLYSPLVKPGGVVALHDIVHWDDREDMEVWRIWEEVKEGYRHEEFIAPQDECGIGVLYV